MNARPHKSNSLTSASRASDVKAPASTSSCPREAGAINSESLPDGSQTVVVVSFAEHGDAAAAVTNLACITNPNSLAA